MLGHKARRGPVSHRQLVLRERGRLKNKVLLRTELIVNIQPRNSEEGGNLSITSGRRSESGSQRHRFVGDLKIRRPIGSLVSTWEFLPRRICMLSQISSHRKTRQKHPQNRKQYYSFPVRSYAWQSTERELLVWRAPMMSSKSKNRKYQHLDLKVKVNTSRNRTEQIGEEQS